MLEVYHQKTQKISPSILLQQYTTNRFAQSSSIDSRKATELSLLAYSSLPKSVDWLILSSLVALGSCSSQQLLCNRKTFG